jgi:hypothetical protein
MTRFDGTAHAYIDGAVPSSISNKLPRSYIVRGSQKAPLTNWGLRAYAVCADPRPIQN